MTDEVPPTRGWSWRRLTAVAALIVAAAVALWFWQLIVGARQRRVAVESLRRAGGHAWYPYQLTKAGEPVPDAPSPEPDALSRLIGEDLFSCSHTVNLRGPQFNDEHLKLVQHLSGLQILELQGAQVTDAGLVYLAELTELRKLYLGNTKITDEGLSSLSGLTKLTDLWLHDTSITDAGLEHLKTLTHLEVLVLFDTRVTEAGLARLQRVLPACEMPR